MFAPVTYLGPFLSQTKYESPNLFRNFAPPELKGQLLTAHIKQSAVTLPYAYIHLIAKLKLKNAK